MMNKEAIAQEASDLALHAYRAGWTAAFEHLGRGGQGKNSMALLKRFAELYSEMLLEGSMIKPGIALWRDYYLFTGQHMIRTDEGWQSGEEKQSLIDDPNFIADWILDEVNAPKARVAQMDRAHASEA